MTDEINRKLAAQDTMNTGQLEQRLAEKEDDDEESIVDVDDAKQVLQRSWLGKVTKEKPQVNDDGEIVGFETVWVQVSENSKMNQKGFSSLWGTLLPYLTRAAQMSYLREGTIEKLVKSTVRDLWMDILSNFEEYDMDKESSRQVVGEALTVMIGAINKSRDGRGLVNQERTLVEKIARRAGLKDEKNEDSSIFGMPSL